MIGIVNKVRYWLVARQLFYKNCSLTQLVLICQLGKKAYGTHFQEMPARIQNKLRLGIQEINRRIMHNEAWVAN
jgi:hypothetical protein